MREWVTSDAGYAVLYVAFKGSDAEAALVTAEEAAAKQRTADAITTEERIAMEVVAHQEAIDAEVQQFKAFYNALKEKVIDEATARAGQDFARCAFGNWAVDKLFFRTKTEVMAICPRDSTTVECDEFVAGVLEINTPACTGVLIYFFIIVYNLRVINQGDSHVQ